MNYDKKHKRDQKRHQRKAARVYKIIFNEYDEMRCKIEKSDLSHLRLDNFKNIS